MSKKNIIPVMNESPTIATLDNQLCFALYSASNRLNAIYRDLLKPYHITYTQFLVLMALWEKDDLSISALAERVGLSKATMTPLLRLLEKKQLIQRQIKPDNERQKNIVLTKSGQQLSQKSAAITQEAFCASGISQKQAREIISLCQQIAK
ncbi:MAG: MarR family winged helix-turn-helix transcriptional regulator [Desulfobulbia bacterium]